MPRLIRAAAAILTTIGLASALPASADRFRQDTLEEKGQPISESWQATGRYEGLIAAGMDDVRVTTGDRWQIRASGDSRALAQMRFLVDEGNLIIGRVARPRERYGKVQVEVIAPSIESVTAAGSGALDVDRIAGDRGAVTVAGSGRALLRSVAVRQLTATVAGSGGMSLAGRSDGTEITIAGSGGLAGDSFSTRKASVTVAGSGSARLRSSGPITATIMGSGSVAVTGTTDCRQTRMGSGRLTCTP